MQIASILIFFVGLYAFVTGVAVGSMLDMFGGTTCLLLASAIYPGDQ